MAMYELGQFKIGQNSSTVWSYEVLCRYVLHSLHKAFHIGLMVILQFGELENKFWYIRTGIPRIFNGEFMIDFPPFYYFELVSVSF